MRRFALFSITTFQRSLFASAALLVAACGSDPRAMSEPNIMGLDAATSKSSGQANAAVNRDLATLRSAMARYHNFEFARDSADYNILFMDMCMVDESPNKAGGMGLHFVKGSLIDGEVSLTEPEALLYEPGPGGKNVLVAVEYAIPEGMWTGDTPPMLFGQEFKVNSFGLWALHVWAWKDNPSPAGIFASWNPRVSCQYWNNQKSGGNH